MDNLLTQVHYTFVSNTTGSCPELTAKRLLTVMKEGDSFEGLVVNLACRGDYNVFPNQVKCRSVKKQVAYFNKLGTKQAHDFFLGGGHPRTPPWSGHIYPSAIPPSW